MQINAALHNRVIAKLAEGIAKAEAHYKIKVKMPRVIYDKRGTTAGTANYRTWTIDLNAALLQQNVEDFLERTVPHELAHLINDQVYPESHASSLKFTYSGFKRTKRDVHGATWQSVCRVLGMTDITRCHAYDTTTTKVVKSNGRQIEWKCGCGQSLMLTPKKSAMLALDQHALWHRGCKGRGLTRVVQQATSVVKPREAVMADAPQPMIKATAPAASGTKLDNCKQLYLKYSMCSRSEIIAKFVADAGCTPAGAATYYATCKKLYG